jgi:hypothetical protein
MSTANAAAVSDAREPSRASLIAGRVATGMFAVMMTISGVLFLVGPAPVAQQMRALGYPDYFRAMLGVAKLLGVAALVVPWPQLRAVREWAYAGFVFVLAGAFVSHVANGDPITRLPQALFALALAVTSYALRHRPSRR